MESVYTKDVEDRDFKKQQALTGKEGKFSVYWRAFGLWAVQWRAPLALAFNGGYSMEGLRALGPFLKEK